MPYAGIPEMDAVSALLELRCDFTEPIRNGRQQHRQTQPDFNAKTEDVPSVSLPSTRRLNINLDVTRVTATPPNREIPGPSIPTIVKLPNGGGYIKRNNRSPETSQSKNLQSTSSKRLNLHKKYQEEQRRWSIQYKEQIASGAKKTREISTQTDFDYQLPQLDKMQAFIKELCNRVNDLESQLEKASPSVEKDTENGNSSRLNEDSFNEEPLKTYREKYVRRAKTNSNSTNTTISALSEDFSSDGDSDFKIENEEKEEAMSEDDELSDDDEHSLNRNKLVLQKNLNTSDMVPIGDGNASVPSRLLKQIDWTSYTNATRKLLTAVFSRRVLATHSLTGKRSPAFPGKPAKKKLDPSLVNDIVQIVCERCKVPENIVRTSITTKCADESKMYRSRQKNKLQRRLSKKENEPPQASESEGST